MASMDTLPVLHAIHSSQYQAFTTEELREHFLILNPGTHSGFNLRYTHYDRLITGTIMPGKSR